MAFATYLEDIVEVGVARSIQHHAHVVVQNAVHAHHFEANIAARILSRALKMWNRATKTRKGDTGYVKVLPWQRIRGT